MPKQIAQYDYHSLANLSADGKRSLAIGKGKFKHNPDVLVDYATVFDTETGAIIAQYTDYLNPKAMSLSPDGKKAVFVYQTQVGGPPQDPIFDYLLIIWNTENNTSGDCNAHPKLQIADVAWLDDDRFVAMRLNGYSSVELTIYDVKSATLSQFDYKGYGSWMAVNGNIAIDMENQIHLINPNTGAEIKRLSFGVKDRPAKVHRSLFYAPDGNLIATLQEMNNKAILVWDVVGDAPPIELKGDKHITAIAWSPDSKQILSAEKEDDGVSIIYIWDIATGEKKLFTEVREVLYERYDWVESLHWHGNNVYITLLRSMMVWEVEKGEQEKPKQIAQYTQYIERLNFSADGARAISVFREVIDYGAVVWDTKTGQEIKRYLPEVLINHVMLSPNGEYALIITHERTKKAGELGREASEYDFKDTVIVWHIDQNKTKRHSFPYNIIDAVWLDNTQFLVSSMNEVMFWDALIENNSGEIPIVYQPGGWEIHLRYDGEKVIFFQFNQLNKAKLRLHTLEIGFIKPQTWELLGDKQPLEDGFVPRTGIYFEPRLIKLALSPDRQHFVMLFEKDPTLNIRPVNDPTHITQTLEVGKRPLAAAWSPDSTKIVFAEFDSSGAKEEHKNRVWIWDITTGEKTLFTELPYYAQYTYGTNNDQKAWGIYEIRELYWQGDLIYMVYDRKIQVWEV